MQRRVIEPAQRRVIGVDHREEGAAALDVIGDVLEIEARQQRLTRIAVEDDEVEILDPPAEEIGGRKSDQRQLRGRRAGHLVRRTQNGEMHELDIRVGAQKVAPAALALMRLARNEQHLETVAHAFDDDDAAVIDLGQLALDGRRLELDDIRGRRARSRPVFRRSRPAARGGACDHRAVALGDDLRFALLRRAVDDAHAHDDVLADDAEMRRLDEIEPAVALSRASGDERMQAAP